MKVGAAMNFTRRQFIAASAMAPLAAAAGPASVKDSVQAQARPFDLDSVRLIGTSQLKLMELNRDFLQSLETDRLLHTFRLTAGLPSSAEPLGGWEKPDVELRGHFTGHFYRAARSCRSAPATRCCVTKGAWSWRNWRSARRPTARQTVMDI
jgi:hypothetical protein